MAIEEVDQGIVEQLLPLLLSLLLLLFQLAAAAFHVRRRIAPRGDRQRQNEARTNERRSGMYIKTKTGINSSFSEFFFFFLLSFRCEELSHLVSPVSLCPTLSPVSPSPLQQDEARWNGPQAPPGRSCPPKHARTCKTRSSPRQGDGLSEGGPRSEDSDGGGPDDDGGDVVVSPIPCSVPAAPVHDVPLRPRLTR